MPDAALEEAKAERWRLVKEARTKAEDGGCRTLMGVVDTDAAARLRIAGAVTMALIADATGRPFEIAWTMRDNGVVVHNSAAMASTGLAVGRHVAVCHDVAKVKRAEIDAATTIEAVEAVTVEEGWPDAV